MRITSTLPVLVLSLTGCLDHAHTISGSWAVGGAHGCDDAIAEFDHVRVTATQPDGENPPELVGANTYACDQGDFALKIDYLIAPMENVDLTVERLHYSSGSVVSTVSFTGLDLWNNDSLDVGAIEFP